jgi:hypothetical protein
MKLTPSQRHALIAISNGLWSGPRDMPARVWTRQLATLKARRFIKERWISDSQFERSLTAAGRDALKEKS